MKSRLLAALTAILMPAFIESGQKIFVAVENNLKETIAFLSQEIGPRSFRDIQNLKETSRYIQQTFKKLGYEVHIQSYVADGLAVENIIAERQGKNLPVEILVVGAHYDTVVGTPGADDNASGVAVLLEMARLHSKTSFARTVRFVAFTLEEPPYFQTRLMGSRIYAKSLKKKKENVIAMICLESVGYYSEKKRSQSFPLPFFGFFYPTTGNFITVVGNFSSKWLTQSVAKTLRQKSKVPVETFTGPSLVTGVNWSDHASFWAEGYPAVMLTDTALFRNPNYHAVTDQAHTLNYSKMADLANGLFHTIKELAQ